MPLPEIAKWDASAASDDIFAEVLCDEDAVRANELHAYIIDWAMHPDNLPMHNRAMFLHACAKGDIGSAFQVLMHQFSDTKSVIAPSEPVLWVEWAGYWQRGFVIHGLDSVYLGK